MRDPNRIDPMIEELRRVWKNQPDTRLCQLVSNLAYKSGCEQSDIFYVEDDAIKKALKEY